MTRTPPFLPRVMSPILKRFSAWRRTSVRTRSRFREYEWCLLLLLGFCFAFSSCAKCLLQYETTFLMCAISSSSYFSGALEGFFDKISTICRPLSCPIVSPLSSCFGHPAVIDGWPVSHSFNSSGSMLTRSLNSLKRAILSALVMIIAIKGQQTRWLWLCPSSLWLSMIESF